MVYDCRNAYWIGIYDSLEGTSEAALPREWIMTNGEQPTYFNWRFTQPNGFGPGEGQYWLYE